MKYLLILVCLLLNACGGSDSFLSQANGQTREKVAVIFGDSITAGYMPHNGFVQLRQDLSYTQEIAKKATVITTAIGGSTSSVAAGHQLNRLRAVPADYVIIFLGINDAVQKLDMQVSLSNVLSIAKAYPSAKVIVVAPFEWDETAEPWLSIWNGELQRLANSNGHEFVSLYGLGKGNWWCHQDRHPCATAHREIGQMIADKVK